LLTAIAALLAMRRSAIATRIARQVCANKHPDDPMPRHAAEDDRHRYVNLAAGSG